jgi:hypothetical protein
VNWILLTYRIPRQPSASRVYVWRKLQQLGAVAVQDAAWVLPATSRTREQFQWLAAEITELKGEAVLWEATQVYATDATALQRQFVEPVEAEYRVILAALKSKNPDKAALSKKYQQLQSRDYFASPFGKQVRERLLTGRKGSQR